MVTAIILIGLGIFTQIIVLLTTRKSLPRFTKPCATCGNQVPPTERAVVTYDCPECDRLIGLGIDLNDL